MSHSIHTNLHSEDTNLSTIASRGFSQSEGFQDDPGDVGSHLTAFGSSGIVSGENLAKRDLKEKAGGGVEEKPASSGQEKGKAERQRGGGLERDNSREGKDFRRLSVTAPPEHQPYYQPKHVADLPTHEHPSGSPVGCGSLPGSNNEFGVARLPDERGHGNPYVFSSSTISGTAFSSKMPFKSALKGQKQGSQLPTKEVPSGSTVGVGSLPGKNSEPGIATLPEERGHGRPYGSGRTGFENYSPEEGAIRFERANHHDHGHGQEHPHKHKVPGANAQRGGRGHGRRISTGNIHPGPHSDVHSKIHHFFEEGDHHAMEKVDLPSKEELSGSYCGVGSLPGPRREGAVGLLPYERRRHLDNEVDVAQLLPSTETPSISYGGVGSLPGRRDELGVAVLPDERLNPEGDILIEPDHHARFNKFKGRRHSLASGKPHADMPSTERISGSRIGVGSLPGGHNEEGVAIFPYERTRHMDNEEAVEELLPTSDTFTPFTYGGVGNLPGARDERGVALLPEERIHPEGSILKSHPAHPHAKGMKHPHQQQHHGKAQPRGGRAKTVHADLPSSEHISGSRVGVGSLPGGHNEEGVAIFPYERTRHMDNEEAVEELLPSTDTFTLYVYGGVGNLPGRRDEQGVALLPEERIHPESQILKSRQPHRGQRHHGHPHGQGQPTKQWEGMGNHPQGVMKERYEGIRTKLTPKEMYRAHFSEGANTQSMFKADMPSTEEISGSRCGVGSLPGGHNEEGVAIFPYERLRHMDNEEAVEELMPSTDTFTPFVYGGVGNLPGRRNEKGVAMLPEERLHPADKILMGDQDHSKKSKKSKKQEEKEHHEPHFWEGMGNEPHGTKAMRYEGIRTHLSEKEMFQNHFQAGLDNHAMPKVDLPTREEPSMSRCGVGSLPGGRNEEGVAILPYERVRHMDNEEAVEEMMPSTEAQTPFNYGGVGNLPGKRSEQKVALLPEERLHPANEILMSHLPPRMDQLPSHEHPSGSSVGVASLPGQRNEKGVALTPEERHHPADQILMSHPKKKGAQGKGHGRKPSEGRSAQAGATRKRSTSGSTAPSRSRSGQQQYPQHMNAEEADQEALRQIEERSEMMRQTMQRVGGNVRGAVDNVARGLEEMGHRMRQRFGWEHPGGAPAPATSSGSPGMYAAAHSPGVGLRTVSSGGGGGGMSGGPVQEMKRVHSNLSPTAPEFVPHWGVPGMQEMGGMVKGVANGIGRVLHNVEGGVEGYFHPHPQEQESPQQSSPQQQDRATSRTPRAAKTEGGHLSDDMLSEDDEAALEKVHEAERLLQKAREDEERAGIHFQGDTASSQTEVPGNLHGEYVSSGPTLSPESTGEREMAAEAHVRGGVMRGVGGVEFDMTGRQGGMLPGYPTPAGMSRLMEGRMREDMEREGRTPGSSDAMMSTTTSGPGIHAEETGTPLGVGTRPALERETSGGSSASVRGSVSDLVEEQEDESGKFSGNKTPTARDTAKRTLGLQDLGPPVVPGEGALAGYEESKRVHEAQAHEHGHGHGHAKRRVIN